MPAWLIVCICLVFILSLFSAPITVWTAVTVLIGLIKNNKDIDCEIIKLFKFSVLICARNEQNVIGNLIESLRLQNYKGEVKIYVVADNCTDNTAEVAFSSGAKVFIRNNLNLTGKGYAMKFGIEHILKDNPDTEAICVFDADNLASASFLTEINRAFNSGADVVCGYRDTKNIHDTWISEAYSIYWLMLMRFYYNPRFILGLPSMIGGTGFAFLTSCLKGKGWETRTLTEDVEFSIQQILDGGTIVPANKAVFYDEQPGTMTESFKQRLRWMRGGIQCLKIYFKRVFYGIINGRKNLWDILWYLFFIPSTGLTLVLNALSIIVVYATPGLCEYSSPIIITGITAFMILVWFIALATLKLEKRNIKRMKRAILLYPLFIFTMTIVALTATFNLKTEWTPIIHSDTATIQDREKERQKD